MPESTDALVVPWPTGPICTTKTLNVHSDRPSVHLLTLFSPMARQLSFVLFLLLATLSLVSALRLSVPSPYRRELNSALEEATHTNAQRLTQGLAPLKPRQLWDATREHSGLLSSLSSLTTRGKVFGAPTPPVCPPRRSSAKWRCTRQTAPRAWAG